MKKRYWNQKVGALLLAGLMFSALPVHAFAEEEQKSVDVAAQAKQEVGEGNAFAAQTGSESADGQSEVKGAAGAEDQSDSEKDATTKTDAKTESETGIDSGKDQAADADGESDMDDVTGKTDASGNVAAVEKSELDIRTEENTADDSEEKTEAAAEVKTAEEEISEDLQPETVPEELAIASASNISLTDDAEDDLLGTWTVDNYTSLAFYEDGKGAMLLPTASYDFHYILSDDHLDIDFASSRARDLSYTISLDADTLQLTSGTGTKTVAISLQRVG